MGAGIMLVGRNGWWVSMTANTYLCEACVAQLCLEVLDGMENSRVLLQEVAEWLSVGFRLALSNLA